MVYTYYLLMPIKPYRIVSNYVKIKLGLRKFDSVMLLDIGLPTLKPMLMTSSLDFIMLVLAGF